MGRIRYWKLTIDDVEKSTYDPKRVLTWEIKCVMNQEKDAKFIGVFAYRNGVPYDYESLKGIAYYHNHVPDNELIEINEFLKNKFGGKILEKSSRIILKNSKEIYTPKDIASLAKELRKRFNSDVIITIEFDFTDNNDLVTGLPENKLLPIPGG